MPSPTKPENLSISQHVNSPLNDTPNTSLDSEEINLPLRRTYSNLFIFDHSKKALSTYIQYGLPISLDNKFYSSDDSTDFSYETPPYSPREHIDEIEKELAMTILNNEKLQQELEALEKENEELRTEFRAELESQYNPYLQEKIRQIDAQGLILCSMFKSSQRQHIEQVNEQESARYEIT